MFLRIWMCLTLLCCTGCFSESGNSNPQDIADGDDALRDAASLDAGNPVDDDDASSTSDADINLDAPEEEENTPDVQEEVLPPGSISGRIIDEMGNGLGGIKMLSCTESLCVSGETDDYGEYLFYDLGPSPQKMQATDATGVHMSVIFYQECVSGEHGTLTRDVIMPLRQTPEVSWPEEQGGTVELADGALIIILEEGSLDYPLGYFDEKMRAEAVPGERLPPYDQEPWAGQEERVMGYYLYPPHIMADPSAGVQAAVSGSVMGDVYDIWSVDPDTAKLIHL